MISTIKKGFDKDVQDSPFIKVFKECEGKDGISFISVTHGQYILAHGDLADFDMMPYKITYKGNLYDLIDNKEIMRRLRLWSPTGPILIAGPCSVGWEAGPSKEKALEIFASYLIAMKASSPNYVSGSGDKIKRYFESNPIVVLWEK